VKIARIEPAAEFFSQSNSASFFNLAEWKEEREKE
jgi:hypothetical protein